MARKSSLETVLTTAQGWIVLIAAQITTWSFTKKAIWILICMYVLDFVTGTYASWVEAKKSSDKPKAYFIESEKLRKSFAKAAGYCFFIAGVWILTSLFFDNKIGLPYSSREYTFHQLAIGACIGVEFWSNIENIKRAGFDLIGKSKQIARSAWDLIKTFKNEK